MNNINKKLLLAKHLAGGNFFYKRRLETARCAPKSLLKSVLFVVVLAICNSITSFAQSKQDALVLYRNAHYAEAIEICEAEIAANPDRIDSYVVLCWSLVGNKQYSEAQVRALEGLKISAYDIRLIEILAEAYYKLGKNSAAMEQFQRYVSMASSSAPRIGVAYYYMGEIYIRLARYQHADIAFSMAVLKEPQLDRWWCRLGYAREMAKSYTKSIEAYNESLKLNPSNVDAERGKQRVEAKL